MDHNQFVHTARLENDYKSMLQITGNVITWQGIPAANPAQRIYPSKYLVTYNILAPTVRGDSRQHTIEIDCSSPHYPGQLPLARFTTPVVRHPHFYDDGKICLGGVPLEEPLAALCIRLAGFLQYDPKLVNENSAASYDSLVWYRANRYRFPLDRSPLPRIDDGVGGSGFRRKSTIRQGIQPALNEQAGGMTVKRRNPGYTSN